MSRFEEVQIAKMLIYLSIVEPGGNMPQVSLSLSLSLRLKGLLLYTVDSLFHEECCIRQLRCSSITSCNTTCIAHNHHTDIHPQTPNMHIYIFTRIQPMFKWKRHLDPTPGFEITSPWATLEGLPKYGHLGITFYSGEGKELQGCKVHVQARRALMQVSLSLTLNSLYCWHLVCCGVVH